MKTEGECKMTPEYFWVMVREDVQESVTELKRMYPELLHEDIKDSFTDLFIDLRKRFGAR